MKIQYAFAYCAVIVFNAGCSLNPIEGAVDGHCSVWDKTRGENSYLPCEPRPFEIPQISDGMGDGDARVLELKFDIHDRIVAAWPSVKGDKTNIVIAEEQEGHTWALREPGAQLQGNGDMADVITGPDGSAMVAWRQTVLEGGRVFLSERDAQGKWRDPATMDEHISFLPHAYEPRFAARSSGETLLVWNQWISENFGVAVGRKASPDASWQWPKDSGDVLSAKVFYSNAPRISMNEQGDALIVWYQSSGGPLMVRGSERFGPDGTFSHPGPDDVISPGNFMGGGAVDSHTIANPMPAVAPNGEAAVAWTQEDSHGAIAVYLALRNSSGVWNKPMGLEHTFSKAVGIARCVQVAYGPGGELYIVWFQNEGDGDRVYAARRAASGEWLESGRDPVLLSSEHMLAMVPAISVGKDGAALVAWIEKAGDDWRVAARRTGPGEAWGPLQVISPENAKSAVNVAVSVSKQSGRAVVGFTQGDDFNKKVFMAYVE